MVLTADVRWPERNTLLCCTRGAGGPNPLPGPRGPLNPKGGNASGPQLIPDFAAYLAGVWACLASVRHNEEHSCPLP
jgi:hypothetical protein